MGTTGEMNYLNFLLRATVHIVMTEPGTMQLLKFGSGCLVEYKGRTFLLSVAHITDMKLATCLETGLSATKNGVNGSTLHSVGSMRYYDEYKIERGFSKGMSIIDDLKLRFIETLDFTFCEIKEPITLLQNPMKFGEEEVFADSKMSLYLEDAVLPEEGATYCFFGKIKQRTSGGLLYSKPIIHSGLKFHRKNGRLLLFLTSTIIKKEDFEGCSGAPILDEGGKLVGLAASVFTGTKVLNAFSIDECRRLLDLAIETHLV